MTQVALQFSNAAGTVAMDLTLTLGSTQNTDGSWTVTAASGFYTTTSNGVPSTLDITGLAPGSIDGADDKVFIANNVAVVDLGGVTVMTNGTPDAATYVGSDLTYPADLNLFYTGSTTILGTTALQTSAFGIDTSPITYVSLTSETFTDPSGDQIRVTPADSNPPCFLKGTRIRTPEGDWRVEILRRGDRVLTAEGEVRTILWIGRREVSARNFDPLVCLPIRIRAHALADNAPSRDLLVSPDHALLVGGVLIQAGALVNGQSILRETDVPATFTYYHVECEDHALILAENAVAETFVDNVERLGFDNWAEHEALYPGGRAIAERNLPRAKSARQVPMKIRALLEERAQRLYGAARVKAA